MLDFDKRVSTGYSGVVRVDITSDRYWTEAAVAGEK